MEEIVWDIWWYFINYVVWVLWTIHLVIKIISFAKLRKFLGAGYISYPSRNNFPVWRKSVFVLLVILSLATFSISIIKGQPFFYFYPVLVIAATIYLNGFLKNDLFDYYSKVFYSEYGFSIYPGKLKRYKWGDVEQINMKSEGSTFNLDIKFTNDVKARSLRIPKIELNDYIKIFQERGVSINN